MDCRRRGTSASTAAAIVAAVVLFAAGGSYVFFVGFPESPSSVTTSPTSWTSSGGTSASTSGSHSSSYATSVTTTTATTTATTTVQNALSLAVNGDYVVRLNGTHYLHLVNVTMTNVSPWNMSVPWAIKDATPGGNAIDYSNRHQTAYPSCWDKDSWGGFSVVTGEGSGVCVRTVATLSNLSLQSAQFSAIINGHDELRTGQSLVQLLGFVTASQDPPSRLQYSCTPHIDPQYGPQFDPQYGYVITCVDGEELTAPESSCGSGYGMVQGQSCGPAFSASTSTFPAHPVAVSVVNASSYTSTVALPSGSTASYVTTPDVPWLDEDLVDSELAPSIDHVSGCQTTCSYVHAGQTIEDFTLVIGLASLFTIDSVQSVNPEFAIVSQSTWTASYCTAGASRWYVTFTIPQTLYGSVDSPYSIQFSASFGFSCP